MKTPRPAAAPESDLPRLAAPAQRALAAAGVRRLAQLSRFSEAEVKSWHGLGPSALRQLRRALQAQGLAFAGKKTPGRRRPAPP